MNVVLVVPAYNEEQRIGVMLQDYLQHFDISVRLHIVLNACVDNTIGVVQDFQKKFPGRITYSQHSQAGKGRAVRMGWREVTGEFIGVVDADNSTPACEFEKLIHACQSNTSNGAIASRYIQGAVIHDRVSLLRRFAGRVYRLVVKILFWLPYKDTQCGAKVFKQHVMQDILPYLQDDTMAFDVEVLSFCRLFGYQIVEVPTNWSETIMSPFMSTSTKTIRNALRMLRALWQLRLRLYTVNIKAK